MGSCCSSPSAYEDTQPSHTPQHTSRPQKAKVTGPGRTLGGGGGGEPSDIEARRAAALAAQQRISSNASGGKLATQLASEQGKSRGQHLRDAYSQKQQDQQQPNLQWD